MGNVEVVVFSRDYERYNTLLQEEAKLFIRGRVSAEEDKDAKLLCEQIVTFEEAAQAQANGEQIFRNRSWGEQRSGGRGTWNGSRNGGSVGSGFQSNRGTMWTNTVPSGQGTSWKNTVPGIPVGQDVRETASGGSNGNHGNKKLPEGIWIQFADQNSYNTREQELLELLADSDGSDDVVIYVKNPKSMKVLPPNRRVNADEALAEKLSTAFGGENVKIMK